MPLDITHTTIQNVLTRSSGYLLPVASHSLQPYRGCTFGQALCGVGCYVQHNRYVLNGRAWGGFLEVRTNAADSYLEHVDRETRWAHRRNARFSIFMSSATDPFLPQETRFGITAAVLEAMLTQPPDELILQTHTHRVADQLERIMALADRCDLRVHVSIETDREQIEGLPPHASSIARRLAACAALKAAGIRTVVTVAPLLPIADPDAFFQRIAEAADAVAIDHFIGGDGSPHGTRTLQTRLPAAIASLDPAALTLAYRDEVARIAQRYLPGRVGVGADGFAGRFLS